MSLQRFSMCTRAVESSHCCNVLLLRTSACIFVIRNDFYVGCMVLKGMKRTQTGPEGAHPCHLGRTAVFDGNCTHIRRYNVYHSHPHRDIETSCRHIKTIPLPPFLYVPPSAQPHIHANRRKQYYQGSLYPLVSLPVVTGGSPMLLPL